MRMAIVIALATSSRSNASRFAPSAVVIKTTPVKLPEAGDEAIAD
jgi:hypothetical protein